uniref:Uncharacterized protein n=1 Tax=Ditylenchus dipsaci TaxID=166011 RepID=A0A915CUY9_9BILA
MGNQRVDGWKYHPESRFDDALEAHAQLRGLLEERRNNPSRKFTNYKDSQTSNQARTARIWEISIGISCFVSANLRFLASLAKRCDKSMEEQLQEYENIVRFDEIEKQLMVTRAKQEKDVIYPFKFHDDVEARQGAVERLMQVEENHELRLNRLETLVQQIQGGTSDFNPYLSPAANTGSGLRHASSKSKGRK